MILRSPVSPQKRMLAAVNRHIPVTAARMKRVQRNVIFPLIFLLLLLLPIFAPSAAPKSAIVSNTRSREESC